MGLELDEAVVEGRTVQIQTEPLKVHLGSDATAVVRVSCDSIQRFLSTLDLGGLRDVTVVTEGNLLKVSGTVTVLVAIRATAHCGLESPDGKSLHIVLHRADPSAAASLIEKQLRGINPILDLSQSFLDISISGIEIADGWVVIRGVAGQLS